MQELNNNYMPLVVTVGTTAATLLAEDSGLRTLELTNTGSYDVWLAVRPQEAKVGMGFFLEAGVTKTFDHNSVPCAGLSAIANGGSTTVAIGRG